MRRGLIGEHLGHSYSQRIHETLGGYPYELIEVAPQDLDAWMKNKDFVRIWWAGGIENRRHRRIQTACQIGEPVNGKVSSQTLKIHLV